MKDSQASFLEQIYTGVLPKRVAFSPDLGVAPMSKEIAQICQNAVLNFDQMGAEVTNDIPDFSGVLEGFQTLRALLFGTMMGPILEQYREKISSDIIGNIERGLNITPDQIFVAERVRSSLYQKMVGFFQNHDLLICPTTSVPPFPVEQPYVKEIDGKQCETYIDWFSITFALTMTGCPVVSLPCGFNDNGLPIGIQIVGKPRGEAALLRAAHHLESILGVGMQQPIVPRSGGVH